MKRIVQCPKCEAKLSVFDLGKTISQKCPKCSNMFDVSPDGTVSAPAAEEAPAAPAAAEKATAETEKPASAPVAAPAAQKSPASAPVAAAEPESVVAESGITFLHIFVIWALLFLIIVVQVWTFKKTENRLDALSSHVQTLTKKVMNQ